MAVRIRRSITIGALTAFISAAPASLAQVWAAPADNPPAEQSAPAPQTPPTATDAQKANAEKPQDAPKPPDQKAQSAPGGTSAVVMDLSAIQGLIGKSVTSSAGEDMGRIVDLLVTPMGQVRAAVIDFGGFLGVGSRKVAVDWKALSFVNISKGGAIRLALTRDQVRVSPEYKSGDPVVILETTKPSDAKSSDAKPADAKPTATATTPAPAPAADPKAPEGAGK